MVSDIVDGHKGRRWTPPAPRELPAVRTALAEHMRNPYQLELTARTLAAGKGALVPPGSPHQAAAILLDEEHQRLRTADLYYLTEDMSELVRVAGLDVPGFRLEREDVPAPTGFMLFASPVGGYGSDRDGDISRVEIVACSWGDTSMQTKRDGVWVTFWCPTDKAGIVEEFARDNGIRRADAERIVRTVGAELTWENEAFLPFGCETLNLVEHNRKLATPGASAMPWVQSLRAAWLLMRQPGVTEVEQHRPSRQQQRRAKRDGFAAGDVAVVRLRAQLTGDRPDGETADAARARTVRWMVRGHWRQQPYGPQRSLRRPVWINPHLKGPQGAPLASKEKVILVDQPVSI